MPLGRGSGVAQASGHAFEVRRATPDDAPAMVGVHARSWRSTYSGLLPDDVIDGVMKSQDARIERWRSTLAEPKARSGSLVGVDEGSVLGFVFWGPNEEADGSPETAEVYAIYVDPEVIGHGMGRVIFTAAVTDIAACGFSAAILWVLDTNDRARRFYEAAGWRPDGRTKSENRLGGTLHEVRFSRTIATTRRAESRTSPRPRTRDIDRP